MARRHRIRPGDVNDFAVRNLSQIATPREGSSQVMALLLAAVASISLLVGGIGIMNILLVSVTERTREIGLRMAIGARRLHVLLQFLTEAVFLSLVGGVAGIVFGVGVSEAISLVAGWPTPISPTAILGGFAFSAAVGIFFGYYPARKAARLDPIEALRYEWDARRSWLCGYRASARPWRSPRLPARCRRRRRRRRPARRCGTAAPRPAP